MTENIDKMLARGEKLELLSERTDNLVFEVRAGGAAGGGAGGKRGQALPRCLGRGHTTPSPRARCAQADRFVRTGKTLRRQMWWQNCKVCVQQGGRKQGGGRFRAGG